MALKHSGPPSILVIGDMILDILWHSYSAGDRKEILHNWARGPSASAELREGGALLIARTLRESLSYDAVRSYSKLPDNPLHSFVSVKRYPADRQQEDANVYRVEKFDGFREGSCVCRLADEDIVSPTMLIVNDAGNGFRDDEDSWSKIIERGPQSILLKMAAPVGQGELWKRISKLCPERTVVMINADDLRGNGVDLSRGISWERTALDFALRLQATGKQAFGKEQPESSGLSELCKCRHLLVRFGLEAVLHHSNEPGKPKQLRIFYDPVRTEGEYDDQFDGKMFGFGSVFCASIALDFARAGFPPLSEVDIGQHIRNGIVASRRLLRFGLGEDYSNLQFQHDEIFSRSVDAREFAVSNVPIEPSKEHRDSRSWSFLKEATGDKLADLAKQIVLSGKLGTNFGAPIARFGDLQTLDRSEIESYRSIRNLFQEFLTSKRSIRPLSIAVFGQPGSGKSFGITEVAKSLDSQLVRTGLVFNVAQFSTVKDLTDTFHAIRDVALKGKVPLVFFDEFDASFNGPMGWLKFFLAPMQDGEFKDGETMHPIGKAIFVFAGGTSTTFLDFQSKADSPATKKPPKASKPPGGSESKLQDFVSRLRGFIDIVGPNGKDGHAIIRRAVVLRSLLVRKRPHLVVAGHAQIDLNVLMAFLRTDEYRHGVRSMESLIDMSMLADLRKFERSALPTHEQLNMHVNADNFVDLLSRTDW